MRIEVAGIPAPQGSKRHVGRGRMVEMSRAVGPWREAVRAETQRARETQDLPENDFYVEAGRPVAVDIIFRLPRPKSALKTTHLPAKRPDLDKLCRATLDGLTDGHAFADDSQVVSLRAWKRFANATRGPGCSIMIWEA